MPNIKPDQKALEVFLKAVDCLFPVPLSHKQDLECFAKKLYEKATVCHISSGGEILSLTAGYTDNVTDNIGYISVVAALAAYVMAPKSVGYMFASHKSWEKGYELAVETLGLKPFLELGMRLGEGSGCPIAFQVIKGACDVMRNMATFEEAEINDDYLEEIRKGDCF